MRLRFGTILAAVLCVATAAEAENAREMWDIYTDFGLFEGGVRKTDKGFAADENGIRVETEEKTGVAGVTHRRTVVQPVGSADRPDVPLRRVPLRGRRV